MELIVKDPIALFQEWLRDAKKSEPNDPNAMCLATATKNGIPSSRMVLLKNVDEHGFAFNTNKTSNKAKDLLQNPVASLTFHWKSLRRQVRVVGRVEQTTQEQNDAYFQTRSTISRLGAWASNQSQPLQDKKILINRIEKLEKQYNKQEYIPCPEHWGGFTIIPESIEFWIDGENRLHDRFVVKKDMDGSWHQQRLYP